MSRAKIPPAEVIRGRYHCPVTGCGWDCKDRTSYSRHYAGRHALSPKFICPECDAVHSRRDLAVAHVCRDANDIRRGRKLTYANSGQVRAAFPLDEEEASQEMKEQLVELEREKQQLLADKNQLQVWMDRLKEMYDVEKKANRGLRGDVGRLEMEMEQLKVKYEAEMTEHKELKVYVERLEAKMKEMEADERAREVEDDAMEVDKGTALEEEDNSNSLSLVLNGETDEMLEVVVVDDHGGDQPTVHPSPPGPVGLRRSERKSRATLLKEEQEAYEAKLMVTEDAMHGLVVVDIPGKGRGVKASRPFTKGEFVVEYGGVLMDGGSGHAMETTYSLDMSIGSYMYFFTLKSKKYCLDATKETGRYGRLLNHSRKHPTCVPKVVVVAGTPRVVFLAKHNIEAGQEITFDYGDRSIKSLAAFPWLAQ